MDWLLDHEQTLTQNEKGAFKLFVENYTKEALQKYPNE